MSPAAPVITDVVTALLAGPPLALLGLSFGLGHRFGRGADLWPGVVAPLAAVAGVALATRIGLVPAGVVTVAAAAGVVALGGRVADRTVTTGGSARDGRGGVPVAVLAAVAVVAATVAARGDGPVPAAPGQVVVVAGRDVAGKGTIGAAVVAFVALIAIGVFVTVPRVRLRLDAAARMPHLLVRVGVDPTGVTARLRAATAGVAALSGLLLTRSAEVAPGDAVGLTVVGAEVALLGRAGSVPGALVAATALSLWRMAGEAVRPGWGALAGHVVVAFVVVLRHGRASTPSMALTETVP